MITSTQADQICSLLVDYRKAIVELTTAAPENRMGAAYEFAAIDKTVHELLDSWVEDSTSEGSSDGWIEWGGGECPVETGKRVDVRYRDGKESYSLPANEESPGWRDAGPDFWKNDGFGNDIIAYRIVK